MALVYFNGVVFALSLIIFIAIMAFNIYWLVWYSKNFHKTRIPAIGERITHKGKTIDIDNDEQAKKYPQPVDKLFFPWSVKHKFAFIAVFATALLHFKVTKLLYSRFYMFDMFKAHWEKATLLRMH